MTAFSKPQNRGESALTMKLFRININGAIKSNLITCLSRIFVFLSIVY